MLIEKEFYFVRHGQTNWNLDRRAQGQTDIPLNDAGRREAHRAALAAARINFSTICSSPLSRAIETAEKIRDVTGCNIEIIDDLSECCWGEREGQVKADWFEKWKQGIETPRG
ncbi:MAG: histidine phosphatase family protein, partial [Pseudomonadota bacterium]